MRHLKAGRRLSRNASHRLAMFRNMAMSLFRHERIITTVAKAKEVRPFIEKLITLAKKNTLHARRQVLARLGTPSKAEVNPSDDPKKRDSTHVIIKLFRDIAPRYSDRPGGYLRVLKRHERRLGDAGHTAFLELVKPGETRPRKKAARPAPAPVIATPPAPVPAPAPEPTPTPAAEPQASAPPPAESPAAPPPATTETPQTPPAPPA
jgi:large subunit ribosomal protein L17